MTRISSTSPARRSASLPNDAETLRRSRLRSAFLGFALASRRQIEGLAAGVRSRQNKTLAHTPRLGGDPFQNGDIDPLEARRQSSGRLRPDDWGESNRRNERFERETIMVVLFVRTQHHEHMLSSKERHH
jgi:hypothetical protein